MNRQTKVDILCLYVLWNQLYLNVVTRGYVPRNSENWHLRHFANFRELLQTFYEIMILRRAYSNRVWIKRAEFSLKLHNKVFVQTLRCAVALWKSWVCKYSIRFQVIKLKLLCETLKNGKWKILAWYPKCGDIANDILNAAIDAEPTFKCKWPKVVHS